MHIDIQDMNVTDDITWKLFTLSNEHDMEVHFLNYGGIITKVLVPDKNGNVENVVLGYKNDQDYVKNPNYFGAIVGRVAGRIQDSAFELDGQKYALPANEGMNHLHGGTNGFHQVVWKSETFQTASTVGVKFSHQSPDGENGYPGNLDISVIYELNNQNQLILTYHGKVDKATPLTMTNHSYFNLSGNIKDTIQNHDITIHSSKFVELDEHLIPTGNILDVDGTPFDFRKSRKIYSGITSNYYQNKIAGAGYDHYFIFDPSQKENVVVKDKQSGRKLTVETDQPGMVMYTSNKLGDDLELSEGKSRRYLGLCLETQASPASLHHAGFPSVVLEAGNTYQTKTVFSFGVE
ncbi:galactose mutarotase [Aquibacillus sp. 3ASR75-11]|uniref:Aldose 1-epimerase n=1 Tax=Terrihalobacillus insolitus TaxID=2950438 RepID=A0A9X3WTZ3_9BACI|nr:aldose epimerase family protein [Terrihalobacillus insolitus]MDC3425660.1 galactose mutarotase [Terrihalobacillus insolitus]